jgi:hypothetical protein
VGKPEGTRQLERSGCRWDDNIQIGLKEIGIHTEFTQLRIGAMLGYSKDGNEPSVSMKYGVLFEQLRK